MAIAVSSTPVSVPSGIRVTTGLLDLNGTTYSVGGLAVTNAQWGAGSNGIPNRAPDLVLFGTPTMAATDDGITAAPILRWNKATGKVLVFGSEPLVDEEGLGEDDAAADNAHAEFVAFWFTPDPSGVVTA
jgi:hypothetical protein